MGNQNLCLPFYSPVLANSVVDLASRNGKTTVNTLDHSHPDKSRQAPIYLLIYLTGKNLPCGGKGFATNGQSNKGGIKPPFVCGVGVRSGRVHLPCFFNTAPRPPRAPRLRESPSPQPIAYCLLLIADWPSSVLGPPFSISILISNPASTGQPGNAAASIGASKSRCSASLTITASALATWLNAS